MKLKVFNKQTVGGSTSGESRISFNQKTGVMYFSKKALNELKLKTGDKIEFLQDEERPTDWYINKNTENGFVLGQTKDGSVCASSVGTVRELFKSVKYFGNTASMKVATEAIKNDGIDLYAIITKSISFRGQKSIHEQM